jgi:hypothetical protein
MHAGNKLCPLQHCPVMAAPSSPREASWPSEGAQRVQIGIVAAP